MYRVSLHGPHAAAYWPCKSADDATVMMRRWVKAVSRSSDGRFSLPEDWQVSVEGQDGEGQWTIIAYYGGRKQ
jgi:hypothetical protein